MDELELVGRALADLQKHNYFWTAPFFSFMRSTEEQQAKWWYLAKVQAKKGVPAMVILQQEFIKQRLIS